MNSRISGVVAERVCGRRVFLARAARAAAGAIGLGAILGRCAHTMGFRGGQIDRVNKGEFVFSAVLESDPGVAILPPELGYDQVDFTKVSAISFEVRGWVKKEGTWAILRVQVYDQEDSDYEPSISVKIEPTAVYQTVSIPLGGKIHRLGKVQFLLATDLGSCEVHVRNFQLQQ